MIKILFFSSIAIVFCAFSCQQNPQSSETDTQVTKLPASESEIFAIISNIQETKDTMQIRGPITITRDSVNIDITGYINNQTPALILAQYSNKEEWYYLNNTKVIFLKEYLFQQENLIIENQFFYRDTLVLGTRTRRAPNLDSLQNVSFSKLSVDEDDDRINTKLVNNSATNFIYGR